MRNIKGECPVSECPRPIRARGHCEKHYRQLRIHGHLTGAEEIHNRRAEAAKSRTDARLRSPWSEEQKLAVRAKRAGKQTNTGRTHFKKGITPWNKGKQFLKLRGSNHPMWKGGIANERRTSMNRVEYKAWRDAVFHKDNFTCQICNQYGGYLHADHIQRWAENPEMRFEVSNGRTLCVPCHYFVTFKKKMSPNTTWCNYHFTRKRG